jgi:type II secretory pathway component GspD/PulD (secretin)
MVCLLVAAIAPAAELELLGSLAVALEPEVADKLRLTPEQCERLQTLADEREAAGLRIVLANRGATPDARLAALAPHRAESERLAAEVYTADQRAQLAEVVAQRDDAALRPSVTKPENAAPTEPDPPPAARVDAASNDANTKPAAQSLPNTPSATEPTASGPAEPDDGLLSFNFRRQPWGDVLEWFSERAGLSLVIDTPPPGTLTYYDERRYTAAQAIDVLNGVLLTKGYTLVRKDRMLLVVNFEDRVPPNVVTDVSLDDLDQRGEYELVRVMFPLGAVGPEAAADELQRLVGPQGAIVVLPEAGMVQVTETAGRIRTMRAVLEAMGRAPSIVPESVELRVYSTAGADADSVLAVLQTLLAGSPSARLAVDPQTQNLVAMASESEHAAIRAALEKLQQDGRRVELIAVGGADPVAAASMVNKLFNPGAKSDKPDPRAPVVEPDRAAGAIVVRGNAAQVEQIRQLVESLAGGSPLGAVDDPGNVRTIPLGGAASRDALQRIKALWPTLRSNPLEVLEPTGSIPAFRPGAEAQRRQTDAGPDLPESPADAPPAERGRGASTGGPRAHFASESSAAGRSDPVGGKATVLVAPGASSTVIASDDTEALDVFEQLLEAIAGGTLNQSRRFAVFYLKFSDAATTAATLKGVFGGDSGGAGSLVGDLAGAAIGGAGGDLVGDLLGMGSGSSGSGFSSVAVDVFPDVRLNALLVNASPRDLETIEQLLLVIDQPRGPDRIESAGRPRLITVVNADLNAVAAVVRQVFGDRISSGGGEGPQEIRPEDLIKALSGKETAKQQEPEKMTLGIDERSRSLVVRSSQPLFEEVAALVEMLDRPGVEPATATRVVTLKSSSSAALRDTLSSLLGDRAQVRVSGAQPSTAAGTVSAAAPPTMATAPSGDEQRRQQREMMERVERFRNFQRMIERGGFPGGPPGGGRGRGGRDGGGPPQGRPR